MWKTFRHSTKSYLSGVNFLKSLTIEMRMKMERYLKIINYKYMNFRITLERNHFYRSHFVKYIEFFCRWRCGYVFCSLEWKTNVNTIENCTRWSIKSIQMLFSNFQTNHEFQSHHIVFNEMVHVCIFFPLSLSLAFYLKSNTLENRTKSFPMK